jgi:hypothetical protein
MLSQPILSYRILQTRIILPHSEDLIPLNPWRLVSFQLRGNDSDASNTLLGDCLCLKWHPIPYTVDYFWRLLIQALVKRSAKYRE